MTAQSQLARHVLRFDRALSNQMATDTVRLPFGVARLCPDLSHVFYLSHVEVERPTAAVELFAPVESLFADTTLHHRRVTTVVPEVAWTLAPAMHDRGWQAERVLFMAHDRSTRSRLSPLGFDVVSDDVWATHADAFIADNDWGKSVQVQRDMAARDRRLAQRIHAQWVLSRDGVAGCHVYRHGRIAQIENVHVLGHARGQGLGQGLMAKALDLCADADIVFLTADTEDWPRNWYAQLGFWPVAAGWQWMR